MIKYFYYVFLFTLFSVVTIQAQTNREIADVYFKKAREAMAKIDYQVALVEYEKGIKRLDSVTTARVAEQGVLIYYELKEFHKARDLAKRYFDLERNKKSEIYTQMLTLYVEIEDIITERLKEEKRIEEEKRKKEEEEQARQRELKRIDSLKVVWKKKSDEFSIKADTVFPFSRSKVAVYKKSGKYGLINERGKKIIEANRYDDFASNNNYAAFADKINRDVFYYNINSNQGFSLPKYLDYENSKNEEESEEKLSYNKLMMSENNNLLIIYPGNYARTLIFDLDQQKYVEIGNLKDLLRDVRKAGKVERYNIKDRKIRIDRVWYYFGCHLGEGIFTLYEEEYETLYGFLFTKTGEGQGSRIISKETINYIAYYDNSAIKTIKNGKTLWLNSVGTEAYEPSNEETKYNGKIVITKLEGGSFQLVEDGVTILEDKKLISLKDFLLENK